MLGYYFYRGLQSAKRSPALAAFMVITLACGIACFISTLAILHTSSRNPLPTKSYRLFAPLIDNVPLGRASPSSLDADDLLSYRDTKNIISGKFAERATALFDTVSVVELERRDMNPIPVSGLAASRQLFAMFDVAFKYGQPWNEIDDERGADIIVISERLAEKVFGDVNPVGLHISVFGRVFQISGVMQQWRPVPRFYHTSTLFGGEEDYVFPISTAIQQHIESAGPMRCVGPVYPGYEGMLNSECTWINLWLEIGEKTDRKELQDALNSYVHDQQKHGRLLRKNDASLFNLTEWLVHIKAVESDKRVSVLMASGFLILCMLNTMGLLMASFSGRHVEIGVRRALGASRRAIFVQFMIESVTVGLTGGALGLGLSALALQLLSRTSATMATVAHLDLTMFCSAFAVAVISSMFAGLLPTWRATQVEPAIQLKL